MNDCVGTIAKAEDRLDRVMLQLGLRSGRAPAKAAPGQNVN